MEISTEYCFLLTMSLSTYNCQQCETKLCHLVQQLHRPVKKCWHQITRALPVTTPLQTTYVCLWHWRRRQRSSVCDTPLESPLCWHYGWLTRGSLARREVPDLHNRVWMWEKATSLSKMLLKLICFFLCALIAPNFTGKWLKYLLLT